MVEGMTKYTLPPMRPELVVCPNSKCCASGFIVLRLINNGIQFGGKEPTIPITPGMRRYLRKPYQEEQDPETGELIRVERPLPSLDWQTWSIREICEGAVDGVYAGILQWGHKHNRFDEDTQARTLTRTLQLADVDTTRWQEPAVSIALQRALRLMVRRIEVTTQAPRQYSVEIWLPDAENLLFRDFEGSEPSCLRGKKVSRPYAPLSPTGSPSSAER